MALPGNALSSPYVIGTLDYADKFIRSPLTVDHELGGINLNDSTYGNNITTWKTKVENNNIMVAKSPFNTYTTLLSDTDITEVSLAFDQSMRPYVAYKAGGNTKLWWYDTNISGQTTTNYGTGIRTPFLTLDDKRQSSNSTNDILFFYITSSKLYYRQQRDRFQTARELYTFSGPSVDIIRVGLSNKLRMQIEIKDLN